MNCVHLDFHTSPDIKAIGERFNKKEFTRMVRESSIDLMTVFAKCHHGYCYYPTRIGKMHPGLSFNLLKEQIDAIHDAGAKAPIYITLGWSKLDADEHPEWLMRDLKTGKPRTYTRTGNPDAPLGECSWDALCPVGSYLDYMEKITREVCEQFDVSDGVFFDICFFYTSCGCDDCLRGMREMGLDTTSVADAEKYYEIKHVEMMKRLTGVVHEYCKDAPVFYNGGADMNRTAYHPYQTHYELEDLPTSWGGYDLMPLRAKYFERYGKHFLGMTGKFHHAWGEFGGFKHPEALRYECADMLSVGASISVGDHLHPSGELDTSTYRLISHAFAYARKIEKYSENTRTMSDVALLLSHKSSSDLGASKLLQIMHLDFDVIESAAELKNHRLVILPDAVSLTKEDRAALEGFIAAGGSVLASYESGFEEMGVRKLHPSEYNSDFIECELEYVNTPFLSYSHAYITECEGEVLARVREPYFNRTEAHFCGHKNTPYKSDAAAYPAMVKNGNAIYVAHPVFEAYNASGSYLLEEYITKAIREVYKPYISTSGLPSTARLRLREGEDFLALHLLYASPVNRGNVCLLPDFPTLHGVTVEIATERKISEAKIAPTGENIAFERTERGVLLHIPPFSLHSLIIIK